MTRRRRRKTSTGQATQADPAANLDAGVALTELQRAARRLARDRARQERPGARIEPTPEQLAQGTYATVRTKDPATAAPIEVRRNMGEAIDRYRARGHMTQRQYDAATRYREDYERGGYERSTISRYDGGGGSGDGTPNMSGLMAANNAQLDARRRLLDARAVLGRHLASGFDAIVLYGDTAQSVGERLGHPGTQAPRFAIVYLTLGAERLAEYYRLPEEMLA